MNGELRTTSGVCERVKFNCVGMIAQPAEVAAVRHQDELNRVEPYVGAEVSAESKFADLWRILQL